MPIGYLCQWISYAVFAVVSVCCVPVSLADVLARSAFRAVCAVLWRRLSVSCWLDNPTRQGHDCTVPQRFSFFAFEKPLCIGKLLFQLRQNFVLQVLIFTSLSCTFIIRFRIWRNCAILISSVGLGGISFSRIRFCRKSFAFATIPRNRIVRKQPFHHI